MQCAECGAIAWRESADGMGMVCTVCNALSQDVLAESADFADMGLRNKQMRTFQRGGSARKRRRSHPTVPSDVPADLPDPEPYLRAFQWLLKRAAEGLGDAAIVDDVRDLWFAYLQAWAARSRYPIAECFRSGALLSSAIDQLVRAGNLDDVARATRAQEARDGEDGEEEGGDAGAGAGSGGKGRREKAYTLAGHNGAHRDRPAVLLNKNFTGARRSKAGARRALAARLNPRSRVSASELVPLSMRAIPAFLLLALRRSRSAVEVWDLQRLLLSGRVPYLNAGELLPAALRAPCAPLRGFFRVLEVPDVGDTIFLANRLALATGTQGGLPPPNGPLAAKSLAAHLGLPRAVSDVVDALSWTGRPPGAGATSEDVPLLSFMECTSAAHVAALLVVAVRLCGSWTLWAPRPLPAAASPPLCPPLTDIEASRFPRSALPDLLRAADMTVCAAFRPAGWHGRLAAACIGSLRAAERACRPASPPPPPPLLAAAAAGPAGIPHPLSRYIVYPEAEDGAGDALRAAEGVFHAHYEQLVEVVAKHCLMPPSLLHEIVGAYDAELERIAHWSDGSAAAAAEAAEEREAKAAERAGDAIGRRAEALAARQRLRRRQRTGSYAQETLPGWNRKRGTAVFGAMPPREFTLRVVRELGLAAGAAEDGDGDGDGDGGGGEAWPLLSGIFGGGSEGGGEGEGGGECEGGDVAKGGT